LRAEALHLADRYFLFDNSERRRRSLVIGKDDRIIRLTPDLPKWATDALA
jgi:predicted ABC-type ATPase